MATTEGIEQATRDAPPATRVAGASASPLAEEVNSGAVSVESAYQDTFSRSHRLPDREVRVLRPERIECLVSVACRVDEEKFLELLDRVTAAFFGLDGSASIDDARARPVFRDVLIAAELLAVRCEVDRSHPAVRALVAALADQALADPGDSPLRTRFAERCFDDTARIASVEAAGRYIEFVVANGRLPDRGLREDDARLARQYHARRAILDIAGARHEAVESLLVDAFAEEEELGGRAELLALLESVGRRRAFERLLGFIHAPQLPAAHPHFRFAFWSAIFRIIEREEFASELMTDLNEQISHVFTNARIMVSYHAALEYFAGCLRDTEWTLFEILEERGVQFWDYWMVYRDSTSPGC